MSTARWRRALNVKARSTPFSVPTTPGLGDAAVTAPVETVTKRAFAWWKHVGWRHALVLLAVLFYPAVATPFFVYQVAAQALVLGIISLSLMILAGYGGMVSLAQMTIAGVAAYLIAILGTSSFEISLGWPWWICVLAALAAGTLVAAFIGLLAARTAGIYTIMITLAIGVAFFFLTQQNLAIFNGFDGFQKVHAPTVFGIDWRQPIPFYYLSLAVALAGYFSVKYLARTPFGLALQGVRDNPRRMRAIGFQVIWHQVAAYTVAGFIAALGGILFVWYNGQISPGMIGPVAMINVLVIAVIGGMRHPVGPFVGAIVFVLLQTFSRDVVGAERVTLIIGGAFLLIVLFSPDGLLGLWHRLQRFIFHLKSQIFNKQDVLS